MTKVDYSKLSPELKERLLEIEKENPANKQLQKIEDIALMLQDILATGDEERKASNKTKEEFGALLADVREQLISLNNKENPEAPDHATPIVKKLDNLIETLDKKDFSPNIQVESPEVNVNTPEVNVNAPDVDLRGIEKVIKENLPKAFNEAIAQIPKTEIPEYPDRWDEVLTWLESIDTASRMKPLPGAMSIQGVTPIGGAIPITGTIEATADPKVDSIVDLTTDPLYIYSGEALPGTLTSEAEWRISRTTLSNLETRWADGVSTFTKTWTSRTGYTY